MPVVPADPVYRRKAVAWLLVMAAAGVVAIAWGVPAFTAWLEQQPPRAAMRAMQIVFAAAFAPAIPMALAMARLARRIQTSAQFPPPGMKVLVDTELVTGDGARRQARGFFALAVVLGLSGVIGMVVMPIVVSRIVGAR